MAGNGHGSALGESVTRTRRPSLSEIERKAPEARRRTARKQSLAQALHSANSPSAPNEPKDASGFTSDDLVTCIMEAMNPVLVAQQEGNDLMKRFEHSLGEALHTFATVVEDERRHAESRMHLHESFLRQHADRVAAATEGVTHKHSSHTPHTPHGASDGAPPRPSPILAPVEESLHRLEMALTMQHRHIEDVSANHERGMGYLKSLAHDTHGDAQARSYLMRQHSPSPKAGNLFPVVENFAKTITGSVDQVLSGGMEAAKSPLHMSHAMSGGTMVAGRTETDGSVTVKDSEEAANNVHGASVETADLFTPDVARLRSTFQKQGRTMDMPHVASDRSAGMAGATKTITRRDGRRESIMGVPMHDVSQLRGDESSPALQKRVFDGFLRFVEWALNIQEPPRKGPLATVVSSKVFGAVCMSVIAVNAAFMVYTINAKAAAMANTEGHDEPIYAEVGESIFLTWYTIELLAKIAVHRFYFFVGNDASWNNFDFLLVTMALYFQLFGFFFFGGKRAANTSVLRSLRVLKISKVLRALRLMKYLSFFATVKLIMHSMIKSWTSLFWSLIMLSFIFYLFSTLFVMTVTDWLAQNTDADIELWSNIISNFGSVQGAMVTLFKASFGGRPWDVYYAIVARTESTVAKSMFLFFIAFVKISLFNIMTAIFVEFTLQLAQPDTSSHARQNQLRERNDAKELRRLFMEVDEDGTGRVATWKVMELLESPYTRHCLDVLGLDLCNIDEFYEMMGLEGGEGVVDIDFLVDCIIKMRGNATNIGVRSLIIEAKLLRRAQRDLCLLMTERMDGMQEKITTAVAKLPEAPPPPVPEAPWSKSPIGSESSGPTASVPSAFPSRNASRKPTRR